MSGDARPCLGGSGASPNARRAAEQAISTTRLPVVEAAAAVAAAVEAEAAAMAQEATTAEAEGAVAEAEAEA